MDAETLTPELELSAARMDLWCAASVLANAAYWMRIHASVPQTASVWYAHTILQLRAAQGDATARRKLVEFEQSATRYEGARVALADLVGADEGKTLDETLALTGDDARALREAMARYVA